MKFGAYYVNAHTLFKIACGRFAIPTDYLCMFGLLFSKDMKYLARVEKAGTFFLLWGSAPFSFLACITN